MSKVNSFTKTSPNVHLPFGRLSALRFGDGHHIAYDDVTKRELGRIALNFFHVVSKSRQKDAYSSREGIGFFFPCVSMFRFLHLPSPLCCLPRARTPEAAVPA